MIYKTKKGEPLGTIKNDAVSHPAHYCISKYEPKDVIRDWGLSFNMGSAVKYIARVGYKTILYRT